VIGAAVLAGCSAPSTAGNPPAPRRASFDIIVRGGSVLDGTGRPSYRADVGIAGSHIMKIGDLSRDSATTVIDASGLVVAPGFINIHSHASLQALPTATNMLQQGVTTEIVNADGGGPLDIAQQLSAAETASLAVNVGAYAPFNSAWANVVGNTDRRPTPEQVALITGLLDRALEAGAWGVSAGLDYKPAYYAKTEEVVAALSPLRGWRTNFPNHDRLTPEWSFSSLAAMRETIEIGERAGLVPVITHMKLQGKEQGRADSALAMMRAATARGVYTAADVYPYLAGQTALAALFVPGWAQEGGRDALVQRLRDSSTRTRIVRETEEGLVARVGAAANIYVIGRNKTVAQIMTEMGGGVSPGEAIARILEVDSPGMIATFGAEPDLVKLIQYPDAAIACDCGAARNAAHPRFFGTFPRVLGHYARDTRAISLADAVRKMTGLPASIIGMVDRGFLAVGMAADVAVFDSATVIDHATYESPMSLSDGIRHVIVNGRVALQDGAPTGVAAGRALRRTRAMPSRPMRIAPSLDLRADAADTGRRISVDLARGRLRADADGAVWSATAFGLLQTAPRWASVTGLIRSSAGGDARPFVLIADEEAGAVTLRIDGGPTLVVRLPSRSSSSLDRRGHGFRSLGNHGDH
jgi:N-acyl-D-aspartate/D-glutamate deacylase